MPRPRNVRSLTFWQALHAFAPIMVRLAARRVVAGKNVVGLSHQEIAIETGITFARVLEISESFDWQCVTIGEAEAFCRACNFDPTCAGDRERQREYIRRCQTKHPGRAPHYLTCSPFWATQFLPLVQRLRSRMTFSTASEPSPSVATRSAA